MGRFRCRAPWPTRHDVQRDCQTLSTVDVCMGQGARDYRVRHERLGIVSIWCNTRSPTFYVGLEERPTNLIVIFRSISLSQKCTNAILIALAILLIY